MRDLTKNDDLDFDLRFANFTLKFHCVLAAV